MLNFRELKYSIIYYIFFKSMFSQINKVGNIYIIISMLIIFNNKAIANIHDLYPGDDIQETANIAIDGDTILFHQGVYNFKLELMNRSLTLASLDIFDEEDTTYSYSDSTIWIGEDTNHAPSRCISIINDTIHSFNITGLTLKTEMPPGQIEGGAIYMEYVDLMMKEVNIIDSNASVGGGISLLNCNGTISKCKILRNHALLAGGGVNISYGNWVIRDNVFNDNQSNTHEGGGLRMIHANGILQMNTFSNNVASSIGGGVAIHTSNSTWRIIENQYYSNIAALGGGMAVAFIDSVLIENNIFSENSASYPDRGSYYGGGIYVQEDGNDYLIDGNTFVRNNSNLEGGALFVCGNGIISNNRFLENKSRNSYAITLTYANESESNALITRNLFERNLRRDPNPWRGTVHVQASTNALFQQNDFIENDHCALALTLNHGSDAVASNNYWGSQSGPRHPSNPGGDGDSVDTAINVLPYSSTRFTQRITPIFVPPPDEADAGSVYVGENDTLWIPCGNLAFDWLTLDPSFNDTTDFSPLPPIPWEIHPYDTVAVGILFHPTEEGIRTGLLTIVSDDPVHPSATVTLSGQGVQEAVESNDTSIPTHYRIASIHPNPFNDSVVVTMELPENDRVSVRVLDVIGRTVWTNETSELTAGEHSLTISAKGMASGVYFLNAEFGRGIRMSRRLVHLK